MVKTTEVLGDGAVVLGGVGGRGVRVRGGGGGEAQFRSQGGGDRSGGGGQGRAVQVDGIKIRIDT